MNEHADKLRAPFPTNTIKVKPQSVHEDKGLVTFYVDARLVAERLNEVVGAEKWEDTYLVITTDPQAGLPVECRLTVEGVTKVDVGQIAPGAIDDKAWKSSYSDAFKRAAVKFGIGAYLYETPNIWAEIKIGRNGKAQGFTDAGKAHALASYAKWIGDSAPGTGATKDSGATSITGSAAGSGAAAAGASTAAPQHPAPGAASVKQQGFIKKLLGDNGFTVEDLAKPLAEFTKSDASQTIEQLQAGTFNPASLAALGAGFLPDDDIPFAPSIDGLGN